MGDQRVELDIATTDEGRALVSLRLCEGQAVPVTLASRLTIELDRAALLAASNNPREYGRRLSRMLFGSPELLAAWYRAVVSTRGAGRLRLQLWIDERSELQGLRWETLQLPDEDQPINLRERVLLSRLISTSRPGLPTINSDTLRALVALAAPTDLPGALASFDAEGYLASLAPALAGMALTICGARVGHTAAGLDTLRETLQAEHHHILVLICHGVRLGSETLLILERPDGALQKVSSNRLATVISDLPDNRRPLLAVLMSCLSAGTHDPTAALALGPQLARAGLPAVIAMHGHAPQQLVQQLLPPFFEELRLTGMVDQALAHARATLGDDESWWVPVLYSRLEDGRLWESRMRRPSAALDSTLGQASEQSRILDAYKMLHELLHQCFIAFELIRNLVAIPAYGQIDDEEPTGPLPPATRSSLRINLLGLSIPLDQLRRLVASSDDIASERRWVAELLGLFEGLRGIADSGDWGVLLETLDELASTLTRRMSRVNDRMQAAAEQMQPRRIEAYLPAVRSLLAPRQHDLAEELARLDRNLQRLTLLLERHGSWQDLQTALHTVLGQDRLEALRAHWQSLARNARALAQRTESDWVRNFGRACAELSEAIAAVERWDSRRIVGSSLERQFFAFVETSRLGFKQADADLLDCCGEVQAALGSLSRRLNLLAQA